MYRRYSIVNKLCVREQSFQRNDGGQLLVNNTFLSDHRHGDQVNVVDSTFQQSHWRGESTWRQASRTNIAEKMNMVGGLIEKCQKQGYFGLFIKDSSVIVYFAKGEPRNVEYCKVFLLKCNIWVLRTRKLPDAKFFIHSILCN